MTKASEATIAHSKVSSVSRSRDRVEDAMRKIQKSIYQTLEGGDPVSMMQIGHELLEIKKAYGEYIAQVVNAMGISDATS